MSNKLTESEQIILQKYFDGESNYFTKIRARGLIKSKPSAQEYIEELSALTEIINQQADKPQKSSADLWANISARIVQEERAELYLGARKSLPQKVLRPQWKTAAFGLGSAVTAFVLGVIFNLNYLAVDKPSAEVAKNASVPDSAKTITLASASGVNNIPSIPGGYFEVDWMKSDGRVQMIPHDSGSGGILWVRRLSPAKTVSPQRIPRNGLGANPPIGYNR